MNSLSKVIIVGDKSLFMQHLTGNGHVECPERVEVIENELRKANLMNEENTLKPRLASLEEVSFCHTEAYVNELKVQIKNLSFQDQDVSQPFDLHNLSVPFISGDFQISQKTFLIAQYAAGAPLTALEYILDSHTDTLRAFCLIRPPGHHAHDRMGSGFCVFNNVAIAAKYLTKRGYRTAIIDWDAHHGEGTQELVESDNNIFYFSTHHSTDIDIVTGDAFYPGSHWGKEYQQGFFGNVLNCPVRGDSEKCREGILSAFQKLPEKMDLFKPDFLLISCGFDAHESDPIAGLGLKTDDYRIMTESCMQIAEKYAKGRIVSLLEGGYHLEAIAESARVHVKALA